MFRRFPADILALAATPLFLNLTDRELDAVQRAGTVVDVAAGRTMPCPVRRPAQFAVVIWGQVAATSRDGRRRVLRAGDWFGRAAEEGSAAVPDHGPQHFGPQHFGSQHFGSPDLEVYETLVPTTLFVMNQREMAVLGARYPSLSARLAVRFARARAVSARAREVSAHAASSVAVAALAH